MKRLSHRSSRFYLIVSIAAASLAAVALLVYLQGLRSRIAESGELVHLVVAARDLEAGEVLDPSSLSLVDFPDRYLLPGTFTDPMAVSGGSLRHAIRAGEPVLESALLPLHGGGLAQNLLAEGFRAYPLPSSAVSFPSGELSEGSRVDILAVAGGGASPVLENVEVLGVFGRPSSSLTGEGIPSTEESPHECILLKVTPEEACLLAAAQEGGKVELLLLPGRRL